MIFWSGDRYADKDFLQLGYRWSFNKNIRSNQNSSPKPVVQKLQATAIEPGRTARCLNTANRYIKTGSQLALWDCNKIHPVNGCWIHEQGNNSI